jgi:UDP-glucose 4-epimerase
VLSEIIVNNKIETVFNFAGSIIVSESVKNPIKYYNNNFCNTLSLIEVCVKNKIKNFIFSSTASIYGNENNTPINEKSPINPINPYANSKLMIENVLKDVNHSNPNFNYGILRYFNVAGADYKGRIGQMSIESTHLIKVDCKKALNKIDSVSIFGTDYPTHDGTCIRDYIHVSDLAQAHVDLLYFMDENEKSDLFNCGYGNGYSVKQIIKELESIIGNPLNAIESERRVDDPAYLVADNTKIISELGWSPKHNNLKEIIASALEWEKNL